MNTNEKITALADEAKALLKKGANNLTEDEAKRLMKLYNDTKGLVAQGIKDNVKAATAALEGNGTTAMGKQYLNIKALADALPRSVRQYTSLHKVEKGITSEGSTLVQVPLVNTTPVPGSANTEIPPRLVSGRRWKRRAPNRFVCRRWHPDAGLRRQSVGHSRSGFDQAGDHRRFPDSRCAQSRRLAVVAHGKGRDGTLRHR